MVGTAASTSTLIPMILSLTYQAAAASTTGVFQVVSTEVVKG